MDPIDAATWTSGSGVGKGAGGDAGRLWLRREIVVDGVSVLSVAVFHVVRR